MSNSCGHITHEGVISKIKNGCVHVLIHPQSACAQCHAQNMCSLGNAPSRTVIVSDPNPRRFFIGQQVRVGMEQSSGTRAVMISYIIPLFLMLIVLMTVFFQTKNELFAGIAGLIVIIPYYILIFFLRHRIEQMITFKIFETSHV